MQLRERALSLAQDALIFAGTADLVVVLDRAQAYLAFLEGTDGTMRGALPDEPR